jgi:serine/threonine protein kinase
MVGGLALADARSDVYSLSKVLHGVFTDAEAGAVRGVLAPGMAADPPQRPVPGLIADELEALARPLSSDGPTAVPPPVISLHWDAGHVVVWGDERYRVVSRLGEGGAGRTYKLEQLGANDESIGVFVGKIVLNPEVGPDALEAYRKVRSIADHRCLSGIYQTAGPGQWSPDTLIALLKWRKGEPLDGWRGEYLTLVAEEIDRSGPNEPEALLLQWAEDLCEALNVLHAQDWVHGDVSPSNIIFDRDAVTLIDFDLACRVGTVALTPGTQPYASRSRRANQPAMPADDVFALAASLFHVLTDRLPFVFEGVRRDDCGLAWQDGERQRYPKLAAFLDRAVDPDPTRRFETAGAALQLLRELRAAEASTERAATPATSQPKPLRPNVVLRVKEVLRAYPGSRFGNADTRGLDSDFAHDTYVETELDRVLPETIRVGEVSLVILCGNAGDGKTAFLQHLAAQLGVPELPSERRVWDGEIAGVPVKINLDGAAAWKGRSADELLDELFQPFHEGAPRTHRVHLVAVNDGRLMEWLESYEARHGETRLTRDLAEALEREGDGLDPHIHLIELNLRSLVGGINSARSEITVEFVDRLCAQLVGGDKAPELWKACHTCSARSRCSIRVSAEMMGASTDATVLSQGALLRRRLAVALQAVHQRNEVHITARELKAALSYILFGIHACEDVHANVDLPPHIPADAVFDPRSPLRQGELLRELTRLDPALEAHARIDRYLISRAAADPAHGAPRYPDASLPSARRRAYLEWTDDQIAKVGGDSSALGLNGGRHFAEFRDFPLLPTDEQRAIRDALCRGLSRLEALPEIAFRNRDEVPIRVVPRTPTETAFWVGKPLKGFTLEAEQFLATPGLTTLHRYLRLSYRTSNGHDEGLTVSLELFALLMDLSEGVQIIDAFSDDVFANLGVFTQRLAQEDEQSLHASTPAADDRVLDIDIQRRAGVQTIVLNSGSGRAA